MSPLHGRNLPDAGSEPRRRSDDSPANTDGLRVVIPRLATRDRRPNRPCRARVESLEQRVVLSAAFQAIGLDVVRADPVIGPTLDGLLPDASRIGVALIDTGVDGSSNAFLETLAGAYDSVLNRELAPRQSIDFNGQGTSIGSVIATPDANLSVATRGNLVAIRATPVNGREQAQSDALNAALGWVAENAFKYNIRVVQLPDVDSQTVNSTDQTRPNGLRLAGVDRWIGRLESLGITVVAPAGDAAAGPSETGTSLVSSFATLAVASTVVPSSPGGTETLSPTSKRGTAPTLVAAPGEYVRGLRLKNDDAVHRSGTPQAAGVTAGVVALMQDVAFTFGERYLGPAEIRAILKQTADGVPGPSNDASGVLYDRINADRALRRVRELVLATDNGAGELNNRSNTAIDLPVVTPTQAVRFVGGIGFDGRNVIGPNDVDLMRVQVAGQGVFALTLSPLTPDVNPPTLIPTLRLFDANGVELASAVGSTNQPLNLFLPAVTTSDPRTYYIGVSATGNASYTVNGAGAAGGGSTGSYLIGAELLSPDPDGYVAGARPLPSLPVLTFEGDLGTDPPALGGIGGFNVGPGDVDMFQVRAIDDGSLRVEVEAAGGVPGLRGYIAVYHVRNDGSLEFLGASTNTVGELDSRLVVPVTRNAYYLIVLADAEHASFDLNTPYGRNPPQAAAGGRYRMNVFQENGDENGSIPGVRPEEVQNLPVGGDAFRVRATIGSDPGVPVVGADGQLDIDTYAFRAAQAALFQIDLDDIAPGQVLPVNLNVWVYDPPTRQAARLASTLDTGATRLSVPVAANQIVYVQVHAPGNETQLWYAPATGIPRAREFRPIDYSITARMRPFTEIDDLSDDFIGAGGIPTVTGPARGVGYLGYDQPGGQNGLLAKGTRDIDLVRVQPTRADDYTFTTFALNGRSPDTVLRLFDADGNQLAANDDLVPNVGPNDPPTLGDLNVPPHGRALVDARLTHRLEAGRTYYVGVSAAGAGAFNYDPNTSNGAIEGPQGPYGFTVETARRPPVPEGSLVDFIVNRRDPQRSFVNHVEMVFTPDTDVRAIVESVATPGRVPRIRVFQSNLHGQGAPNAHAKAFEAPNPSPHGHNSNSNSNHSHSHNPNPGHNPNHRAQSRAAIGGRARAASGGSSGNPLAGMRPIPIANLISFQGDSIFLDWGLAGIGGQRGNIRPDGVYTVLIDSNGDGVYESRPRFFRLLGDVNGDRVVNQHDEALITQNLDNPAEPGRQAYDLNGDGVVDRGDLQLYSRLRGRRVVFNGELR